MTNIRYVCLSDLHLGADNSILTNLGPGDERVDPYKAPPVLVELANCLRALIAQNGGVRPELILNGDLFELALAQDNVASMAFQRFIELVMPPRAEARLFADEIIFIPGNHDHHLWETARETQYANYIGSLGPADTLNPPWHTTSMLKRNPVPSQFLDALLRRCALPDVSAKILYPNYGLIGDHDNFVIFSHGHYTESIYTLMTTLNDMMFPGRRKIDTIYDIEADNFAWVDFFWSTMGRSGTTVGPNIERAYESMQDPKAFADIVARFAGNALTKYGNGLARFPPVKATLMWLLKRVMTGRPERAKCEAVLGDYGEGLRGFLTGPIKGQLACELDGRPPPESLTFIFGHTHKPFEEMMPVDGMSVERVAVYNSGGWVVDRPRVEPVYGGAIILVDDECDVCSVRMYNESKAAGDYSVKVATASASTTSPFAASIEAVLRKDEKPWRNFSTVAAAAVEQYTSKLAREIGQSK